MATTTISVDVVNDVGGGGGGEVVGEKEKPSRKFPLPCWTQGETLALIDAYRKRWYALRRGYLRTADWDAVAESVVSRFPGVSPSKTSAQCRHKMEKLRQRYRAEKQRSLSFPAGKFFSSWFFFENMDAMENGSEVGSGLDLVNSGKPDSFFDQNTMKLKLNNNNNTNKKFDHGIMLRNSINGRKRSSFESGLYMDPDSDKEDDEPGFASPVIGLFATRGGGSEGKNFARNLGDFKANNVLFNSVGGTNYDEFHTLKSSENEALLPPRLRVKRMERDVKDDDEFDDRFSTRDMNSMPPSGFRGGRFGRYVEPETAYYNGFTRAFGGVGVGVGVGAEKKGSGNGGGNAKRERSSPIEEMVSAIKMLGEGFVKMEKMKMEMAMEIEKNRMEMEMKRHELILQSQGQIVEAFTRSFIEMNKKMKMAVPES